eukprot:gene819-116_t
MEDNVSQPSGSKQVENLNQKKDKVDKIKKGKKKGYEWSHDETMQLIDLWQNEFCLFDTKRAEYRDKNKRFNALKRIENELNEQGIKATMDEITAKLHSLRVYYCATRSKAESFKRKSGSGTDEIPKVKWPFYEKLFFLSDNVTPRNTVSNLESSNEGMDIEEEFCDSPLSTYSAESLPVFKKAKRKLLNSGLTGCADQKLLETATSVLEDIHNQRKEHTSKLKISPQSEKTTDDLYCEMLAKQLKELSDGQDKEILKYQIQGMILRAKFQYNPTSGLLSETSTEPSFQRQPSQSTQSSFSDMLRSSDYYQMN